MHIQCPAQAARRAYRELLYTAPIGEAGVSGTIMFKETLYQSTADGTPFVDVLSRQGVLSGIKVDEVSSSSSTCTCGPIVAGTET